MTRIDQQLFTTKKYIIPYLNRTITEYDFVLDIGCDHGGSLKAFGNIGLGVGIDTSREAIEIARKNGDSLFLAEYLDTQTLPINFDIILLKDTIEHISNKEAMLNAIKSYLLDTGVVFISFPPWYSPYGGHQQTTKLKIPYIHLLPKVLYKVILKITGESSSVINELISIYDTRATIEQMNRVIAKVGLKVVKRTDFIISPNYDIRYGIPAIRQFKIISAIPYLRNFLSTCTYYLLTK